MLKTTVVAFFILYCSSVRATPILPEINQIESQWARIYYEQINSEQKDTYPELLKHITELSSLHPESQELIIWRAILLSTNAEHEDPFTALESINTAKKLLEYTIKKAPQTLDGAAYVVLGTLYYMTPGWPISFGNANTAEKLLQKGQEINPNSIDANYFYADYFLSVNQSEKASKYFKLAIKSPVRAEQKYADTQLKREAKIALLDSEQRKLEKGKNNFFSLFSNARYD